MEAWTDNDLGRAVVAFSALLLAGVWVQLTLFHWAGAFRRREMVVPVITTPLIVLLALLGVLERDGALGWIALAALVFGVLEGMIGIFFHSQAMVAQVGGPSVRNLIAGPPPVLPLAYSLVAGSGLIGLLWNA
jgi:hypothetical protein